MELRAERHQSGVINRTAEWRRLDSADCLKRRACAGRREFQRQAAAERCAVRAALSCSGASLSSPAALLRSHPILHSESWHAAKFLLVVRDKNDPEAQRVCRNEQVH